MSKYLELKQKIQNKDCKDKSLIKIIIGELDRLQNKDDKTVNKILIKLKQNAVTMNNQYEIDFLNTMLPQSLDTNKILEVINTINETNKGKKIGMVISKCKELYPNYLIDNKFISQNC